MCMNVHTCAHTQMTHTHTHTHTQRACTTCSDIGSYFSHKVYMCMNVHACAHTHDTHIDAHTYTHTDWACTTCSDFGLLFLTLYSQSMYMCKKILAHCYVNSPYTIFVTNTYTHTTHMCTHTHAHAHTQTGLVTLAVPLSSYFSHCLYKAYMCMNVHTHIKPVARGGSGVSNEPPPPPPLKGSRSAYVVRVPACEASGTSTQTPMGELTSLPPPPLFVMDLNRNAPPPHFS